MPDVSRTEGFADVFRQYVLDRTELAERCPQACAYMDACIAQINHMTIQNFDSDTYAAAYPDVVQVVGADKTALYTHFKTYGSIEHRKGNFKAN